MPFDGIIRGKGCLRDVKDTLNDWRLDQHPQLFSTTRPPETATLKQWLGPVLDQGQEGSCTAHGTGGAAHLLINKRATTYDFPMSMNFQYWNSRFIDGSIKSDAGAQIRSAMKALAKYGICQDALWPYDYKTMFSKPTQEAYDDAVQYKALDYYRLSVDKLQIMQAIASGFPVVIGISLYNSFESDEVAKTGFVPMPVKGEGMVGGHCMFIYAYDAMGVWVRNSWGPDWGVSGDCYLLWPYVASSDFGSDYWTLRMFGSDAEKRAGLA